MTHTPTRSDRNGDPQGIPRPYGLKPDAIRYINLDTRTDRRDHMERQSADIPFPFGRVSAIRLQDAPEKSGCVMEPQDAGKIGVASIFLSHLKTLDELLQNTSEGSAVLLEDDVHIDPLFWQDNEKSTLPEDWEIVLFSPRFRDVARSKDGTRVFAKLLKNGESLRISKNRGKYICTGAHFTVFRNRDIIEKALADMKRRRDTIGMTHVDKYYAYLAPFRSYAVYSRHVRAGGFGSDHLAADAPST